MESINNKSPVFSNERALAYWLILVGVPVVCSAAALLLIPLSAPQPAYLKYAQEYAKSGRIAATTYPAEFAWLTGLSIVAFGNRGPELLQTALYLLTVMSVWALARKCGAGSRNSLFAGLAAAFYPQLIVSVTKVWDVELAVLLMVVSMLFMVSLLRDGLRPSQVLGAAIVFGLSVAQRPNMIMLLPLPLYLAFAAAEPWYRKGLAIVCGTVLSLLVLITVNTLAHGSFFLPQNGPYNLVQGHNEYSIPVMLEYLTTEPTVELILRADGKSSLIGSLSEEDEADPKLQGYFLHRAFAFVIDHPLEEAKIAAVKIWTIFRPDMKTHRWRSPSAVFIVCMSSIFPVWLIVVLLRNSRSGLDNLDWTFALAVILYILPFLITASDPRYQIALEICLLSHLATMAESHPRTK